MKEKRSTFAQMLGCSGEYAEIPEGTEAPFAYLMEQAELTALGIGDKQLDPAAAAKIAAA